MSSQQQSTTEDPSSITASTGAAHRTVRGRRASTRISTRIASQRATTQQSKTAKKSTPKKTKKPGQKKSKKAASKKSSLSKHRGRTGVRLTTVSVALQAHRHEDPFAGPTTENTAQLPPPNSIPDRGLPRSSVQASHRQHSFDLAAFTQSPQESAPVQPSSVPTNPHISASEAPQSASISMEPGELSALRAENAALKALQTENAALRAQLPAQSQLLQEFNSRTTPNSSNALPPPAEIRELTCASFPDQGRRFKGAYCPPQNHELAAHRAHPGLSDHTGRLLSAMNWVMGIRVSIDSYFPTPPAVAMALHSVRLGNIGLTVMYFQPIPEADRLRRASTNDNFSVDFSSSASLSPASGHCESYEALYSATSGLEAHATLYWYDFAQEVVRRLGKVATGSASNETRGGTRLLDLTLNFVDIFLGSALSFLQEDSPLWWSHFTDVGENISTSSPLYQQALLRMSLSTYQPTPGPTVLSSVINHLPLVQTALHLTKLVENPIPQFQRTLAGWFPATTKVKRPAYDSSVVSCVLADALNNVPTAIARTRGRRNYPEMSLVGSSLHTAVSDGVLQQGLQELEVAGSVLVHQKHCISSVREKHSLHGANEPDPLPQLDSLDLRHISSVPSNDPSAPPPTSPTLVHAPSGSATPPTGSATSSSPAHPNEAALNFSRRIYATHPSSTPTTTPPFLVGQLPFLIAAGRNLAPPAIRSSTTPSAPIASTVT